MMTTPQLKAARALLDWTQADLAKAAGIHLNVINNLERGMSDPRRQTVERLQKVLTGQGIIFIGSSGVELKREAVGITKHQGNDCFAQLVDDILNVVRAANDEVLSIVADMRDFAAHEPAAGKRYASEKAARGFNERLITRAMPGFYPRNAGAYRVVDPQMLGGVDTVIYGDRVAHLFWSESEIVILKNADLASAQRKIFEEIWALGQEPARVLRAAED